MGFIGHPVDRGEFKDLRVASNDTRQDTSHDAGYHNASRANICPVGDSNPVAVLFHFVSSSMLKASGYPLIRICLKRERT